MNCPHCGDACQCGHGKPTCVDEDGCGDCDVIWERALDLAGELARCGHGEAKAREATWCNVCGAVLITGNGAWLLPEMWDEAREIEKAAQAAGLLEEDDPDEEPN